MSESMLSRLNEDRLEATALETDPLGQDAAVVLLLKANLARYEYEVALLEAVIQRVKRAIQPDATEPEGQAADGLLDAVEPARVHGVFRATGRGITAEVAALREEVVYLREQLVDAKAAAEACAGLYKAIE